MILHIEKFHLDELSDTGIRNLCKYAVKKGIIAQEMLPDTDEKGWRTLAMQTCAGRLLLNIGQLLEFIDTRVPFGAYNIKRNASRNAWKFDHEEVEVNSSEPYELLTILWNVAKPLFEQGVKIN